MSTLTPEMRQWLSDNNDDYEFYLLHAMFHDPLRRSAMLTVPVEPLDFRREDYGLVVAALIAATKVMRVIGHKVPTPPSVEFMRTYVESAARQEASDDEVVADTMRLLRELQDTKYIEMHFCVPHYFEAWYGSARSKRSARKVQLQDIPDVRAHVGEVQAALAAAAQGAVTDDDDDMTKVIEGTSLDQQVRRPTGIDGLDQAMNGGWGDAECYLLFGGTGGGKSIAAGQCAYNEAEINGGYSLIVSTELQAREYVVRIVSYACTIDIGLIQDCENFAQIRNTVSQAPGLMHKLAKLEKVFELISKRIRIAKVRSDDGLDARAVIEREVLRMETQLGHRPTWVCLDWLGSMADVNTHGGTSERAMAWEIAANGCVKFAEDSTIPTLVLAQAVNDAQLKRVLVINDIGISKGIGKNMILVVGITNTIDQAGIKMAVQGKAEMPRAMILEDQFFCVCKARKGEGSNIPVRRAFRYQKFIVKPRD